MNNNQRHLEKQFLIQKKDTLIIKAITVNTSIKLRFLAHIVDVYLKKLNLNSMINYNEVTKGDVIVDSKTSNKEKSTTGDLELGEKKHKNENLHRAVIFIIDDDPLISTSMEYAIISGSNSAKVYKFSNVGRALGNSSLKPDIIFLDHYLDYANGVDALPAIKKIFPNSIISIVSGQKDPNVFCEAYSNGADIYFIKDENLIPKVTQFVKDHLIADKEVSYFKKVFRKIKPLFLFRNKPKRIKKNIAVIVDNLITAFKIEYVLKNRISSNSRSYSSIKHFLSTPKKFPLDIIIVGYLLKKNRKLSKEDIAAIKNKYPNARLVLLSSKVDVSTAEKMLTVGIDYYLTKSKKSIERLATLLGT